MLRSWHLSALALAALYSASPAASAQVSVPGFLPGSFAPYLANGAVPDGWYLGSNMATAGTVIDAIYDTQQQFHAVPSPAQFDLRAESLLMAGGRTASALGLTHIDGVGAAASAIDRLDPSSTLTAAVAQAQVWYWGYSSSNLPVSFDIRLSGLLGATGSRGLGNDPSGAAVAALAMGSISNGTTEAYNNLVSGAGLNPAAEGAALLAELQSMPVTHQRNLATFGAQASVLDTTETVDTVLHVTADPTQISCEGFVSPVCGKYFYFLSVYLFNGAQNGGFADFSQSLKVETFSVGNGAPQVFSAQTLSAVPEPTSALLLAAGLSVLAVARRKRG
jgi:hypothetical protein